MRVRALHLDHSLPHAAAKAANPRLTPRRVIRTWVIALTVVLITITAAPSHAQDSSAGALISEALDRRVTMQIKTTLPGAMKAIGDQTGVPVQADRQVWDLLPWGEQTNVTATVADTSLRSALDAIAGNLGLVAVPTERFVELRPLPPLRRLGRRATLDELTALHALATTQLKNPTTAATARALFAALDAQLALLPGELTVANRVGPEVTGRSLSIGRGATLYDALESFAAQTEATWYVDGRSVVVLPKEDQVRAQIARRVNRNYSGVPIGQVLTELSQAAGVEFTIEPGAIQRIAPEFRTIRLLLDNAPIEQALEHIAGFTGLGYVVNDRGVYLWAASTGSPTSTGRDPVVAIVEVSPGVQVLVPQSQVPPEARERLRTLTVQRLDALTRDVPPASQPATTQP